MDNENRTIRFCANEEDIPAMIEEMKKLAGSFQAEVEEVESTCENTDFLLERIKQQNPRMYWNVVRLLNTIAEKMSIRKVNWKVIRQFLITANAEICMSYMEYNEYNQKHNFDISESDIVTCNYGRHLEGEIGGDERMALVCKKEAGSQIYLVPILRKRPGKFRMLLNENEYCVYNERFYGSDNYLLIDRGCYVNRKRIQEIVGKVTPQFLQKVLQELPKAFDFANTIPSNGTQADCKEERGNDEIVEDIVTEKKDTKTVQSVFTAKESTENFEDMVKAEESIKNTELVDKIIAIAGTKTSEDIEHHTSEETKEAIAIIVPSRVTDKKMSLTEVILSEVIGGALDNLDTSKEPEEQIDFFLIEIGMPREEVIKNAFIAACNISKITYPNTVLEVFKMCQDQKEDESTIERKLKENFQDWLTQHPALKEKCPKISFMNLLRIFAKKFAN